MKPLKVLVVDDSVMNRRTLTSLLQRQADVAVVGAAADGDEALRLVAALQPDLITLDLEMPRMDGFTFLRLLMANRPTPVVVISSHAAKENVFRALEVGAIDFITKPDQLLTGAAESIRSQLETILSVVRQLSPTGLSRERGVPPKAVPRSSDTASLQSSPGVRRLVVVAASTGGPAALVELFAALPRSSNTTVVVAQHMPDQFTPAFAQRLDRQSALKVLEAEHRTVLEPGMGIICPGGRSVELAREEGKLVTRVRQPDATDRYAPSADRLFKSAAEVMGENVVGVVLTGMGSDGTQGALAIKRARGLVLAEAESTAVVYGMPKVAIQSGAVDEVLPLPALIQRLVDLLG
jgi:two-component system chemotaxis response regulator CheB